VGGPIGDALRARAHAGFLWRPPTDAARGEEIAAMAAATDGGVLVLVPEVRAANDVVRALSERFGDALANLGSDRSQRARYRDWLALRAGAKRIAVGGRAAVFAPVADLGLIVIDDEGHSSYKEGRAPRFHARTVAAERARRAAAVLVMVGLPGSVEARAATTKGPYRLVAPPRGSERTARPPVTVVERAGERLAPTGRTLTLAKRALAAGERVVVLVHRGEALAPIAERALRILEPSSHAICSATTPAADLRRAARSAAVVVATPVVAKDLPFAGRALLVICEAEAALAQPEFRAPEDAFATWWRAARWATHVALETDDPDQPAIRALVRWDPEVLWRAELARREELSYPPFAALARIDVPADRAEAVAGELRDAQAGIEVLGPVERADRWFVVARASKRRTLLDALGPFVSRWRADDAPMRVDVDPWEVLATRWRS
jgi:primosomal protein N' (replication factor Y)